MKQGAKERRLKARIEHYEKLARTAYERNTTEADFRAANTRPGSLNK